MGKKFTEREKEQIRLQLLEIGKNMFGIFGLKKTSIASLTKAVGIAQGTFYLFFSSKEELYFEILGMEEEQVRQSLLTDYLTSPAFTKEEFKQFLQRAIAIIDTHPIFRQVYEEGVLEQLLRRLPPEKLEQHMAKDSNVFLPLIQRWQQEGKMVKLDPELIISVIRSLILLTLQKKMIGEELYQPTIELYIDFIADGLMEKGD
ncbi:TetR/AcrR family transcriptional regulator [Laceyella putida]|uniref:TetR/AcrR family transcriptional regulator n=1 Tax=Laceyella putida TaxID=110101 RepID=A0ABW2RPX8_9BACL